MKINAIECFLKGFTSARGQKTSFILLFILCIFYNDRAAARNLADLKVPPASTVRWLASDIAHNDHTLQIQLLESNKPIEQILIHYRTLWANNAAGAMPSWMEQDLGGWKIISTFIGGYNFVVQLRPDRNHGTTGYISLLQANRSNAGGLDRPNSNQAWLDAHIPIYRNAMTISRTLSNDPLAKKSQPRSAFTQILTSTDSPSSIERFYRTQMIQKGWDLAAEFSTNSESSLLFYRQGSTSEIAIATLDERSTVITINSKP